MKDKITNICGLAIAICGAVLTAEKAGVAIPQAVTSTCILVSAIAIGIVGYFTGKPNNI